MKRNNMANHFRTLSLLVLLSCMASAHAQLYKSIGPDGKVIYSDTPPAEAKRVEAKSVALGEAGGRGLPYELSEAVKNSPVTLYTGAKCIPCDDGRKLLNTRGIPFTEKTVTSSEDVARLRQAGGDTQLPLLIVGRNKQQGFEAGGWGAALTAAGYPETSKLPRTYLNPPAEAAAPPVPTPVAAKPGNEQTATTQSNERPPAIGNAPPGFRF
jgi:glutaredoxin